MITPAKAVKNVASIYTILNKVELRYSRPKSSRKTGPPKAPAPAKSAGQRAQYASHATEPRIKKAADSHRRPKTYSQVH